MDKLKLCFDCRIQQGYKGRDDYAHTAMRAECEGCKEIKIVLPGRHWVKDEVKTTVGE